MVDEGLADDLGEMIADLPATMIYGGREYTVTASEVTGSKRIEIEGMEDAHDLEVVAEVGDFTAGPHPKPNAVCKVDDVGYKILRVQESPDGLAYTLYMGAL